MERSRSVKAMKDRQTRASRTAAARRARARATEAAGGAGNTRADETEELFGVEM